MLHVHRLRPDEWERLRDLRLRALALDPDAFFSTLDRERSFGEDDWRGRLADPAAATLVLVDAGGADAGLASSHPARDPGAGEGDPFDLAAMWVEGGLRGSGAGALLLEAALRHAEASGAHRVLLWVAAANERAIRFYRRHGFVPTGRTGTFPPPRHTPELEMERTLREPT